MIIFHASHLYSITKRQHYFLNSDEPELPAVGCTRQENQL